ncbi:MAG TPA: sulfotransferase [Bryobacteraceae bacterium]
MEHHRAGRLDQATGLYRQVLAIQPDHADALHFLGVAAHQQGDHLRAIGLIRSALAATPRNAACYCNLAEAHRAAKQFDQAEACCRTALLLRPQYPAALQNLAAILFLQRQFQEAEEACRSALALRPDFSAAALTLADILREQGRIHESLEAYRHTLELAPKLWAAHANYGLLAIQTGELEKGLTHCRRAVELAPGAALPLQNLGRLLLDFGSIDDAMEVLGDALELDPDSASLCTAVGTAWMEIADYQQAQGWFERALELDPESAEARCCAASLLLRTDHPEEAAEAFRAMLGRDGEAVEALIGLAQAQLDLGEVEGSVASYRQALRLRPEAAALHAALGHTLSTSGDLSGAVAAHRKAIELNPACVPAYGSLLTTLRRQATDAELQQAEELLGRPWMTDHRGATLHFGLAHAYDGRGDWRLAADHMVRANRLQKSHLESRQRGYDPREETSDVDSLVREFTPEFFERFRGLGVTSERPVFIVGMPRSDTTLTEQILASHPQIFRAGERRFAALSLFRLPRVLGRQADPLDCLRDCGRRELEALGNWHLERLERLDGGRARRVVDKMPDNYHLLGFLAAVFPRARFIHCRRDVRDVALSCWITQFGQIRWAFDLEHIAHRIQQYRRIMAHWGQTLPVPVLDIDYEELTRDQERVSRRLVEWLGLEWDDRCLDFHRTERLVRTASVAQVRQPMYRHSVARWKNYEAMLSPLLSLLEGSTA